MNALADSLREARRILVVGCSGSGKSTLTRALSKELNLPPIFLDVHYWQPQWTEPPLDEWRKVVAELVDQDRWIMDGTFSESFDLRFPRADVVITLEAPRLTCLTRAVLRVLKDRWKSPRPDMPEGCRESFSLDFYRYIWNFPTEVQPKIEAACTRYQVRRISLNAKSTEFLR